MIIEEHIPLGLYTTFKIGGPARYFAKAGSEGELKEAVAFSKEKSLPFFVLGGGSNILVNDAGFPGIVIKNELRGIEYHELSKVESLVIAGAGEEWDGFVAATIDRGLGGLENLSGIPGTVGAAPVQNIGAYGVEAESRIAWVEVYDSESEAVKRFKKEECGFSYRSSFFKTAGGKRFIICRVGFLLSRDLMPNTGYKDIQKYMEEHGLRAPDRKTLRNTVLEIRAKKLPDWKKVGTAGSFFKNPIILKEVYEKLRIQFADMPHFAHSDLRVKIPAAWLLDKVCGFNGAIRGNAGVYKTQALVLINRGGATAKEIDALADEMKRCVFEKTSIALEREVESVG